MAIFSKLSLLMAGHDGYEHCLPVCATDIDYTNVNDSLSGMMLLKSLLWMNFQQWLYQHSIHQLLNQTISIITWAEP